MKIQKLKNRWMERFRSITDVDSVINNGFENLAARYSEKHRHYHNLQHVNACLEHLEEVRGSIVDFRSVEIAIWFHDVIYDPNRNDNEMMSAEYAKAFLGSIGLDREVISRIEYLIVLTRHPSHPVTNDEKYLIDIDLAILGAGKDHYDSYELSIRKEYVFVPTSLYKKGRKNVLESFAKLDRIYQTEYFYKKYEHQARQNINRALLVRQ